jgi:hypothetical protein
MKQEDNTESVIKWVTITLIALIIILPYLLFKWLWYLRGSFILVMGWWSLVIEEILLLVLLFLIVKKSRIAPKLAIYSFWFGAIVNILIAILSFRSVKQDLFLIINPALSIILVYFVTKYIRTSEGIKKYFIR